MKWFVSRMHGKLNKYGIWCGDVEAFLATTSAHTHTHRELVNRIKWRERKKRRAFRWRPAIWIFHFHFYSVAKRCVCVCVFAAVMHVNLPLVARIIYYSAESIVFVFFFLFFWHSIPLHASLVLFWSFAIVLVAAFIQLFAVGIVLGMTIDYVCIAETIWIVPFVGQTVLRRLYGAKPHINGADGRNKHRIRLSEKLENLAIVINEKAKQFFY